MTGVNVVGKEPNERRSLASLRKEHPGKAVYLVLVAEPGKDGGAIQISGEIDPALLESMGPGAFGKLAIEAAARISGRFRK